MKSPCQGSSISIASSSDQFIGERQPKGDGPNDTAEPPRHFSRYKPRPNPNPYSEAERSTHPPKPKTQSAGSFQVRAAEVNTHGAPNGHKREKRAGPPKFLWRGLAEMVSKE